MPNTPDVYISLADRCHREHIHLRQFDLMRAVGCLVVLVSHAARPVKLAWGYNSGLLLWDILFDNITGMFMLISGALLLPICNGGNLQFVRRRVTRLVAPYVIYVVAYIALSYYLGFSDRASFIHHLKWFWLIGGNETNWFMLVLLGIYLFMPFISPWLRYATRRQTEGFLLLWLAATLLPYINMMCGVLDWAIPDQQGSWLRMFYNYLGFYILGYYLVRWPFREWSPRFKAITIVCGIAAVAFIPFCRFYCNTTFDQQLPLRDLSFVTAAKAAFWFLFLWQFQNIRGAVGTCIKFLSRYSYAIYMCHPIWCWVLLPAIAPELSQTWWVIPMTLASTLLTVWPLSHLPVIGRYMH